MTQATCVDHLPVLAQADICLREVRVSDAAALVTLFAQPAVSAHLSPPPSTLEEFTGWITLSLSRRLQGHAACYTLLTGPAQDVSGLFMALRRETPGEAELGFAMAPHLWGTGAFMRVARMYLDFLFTEWGVTRLVGHTLKRNARGVGAMQKLGATVIDTVDKKGEPELVWTITAAEWRARAALRTS